MYSLKSNQSKSLLQEQLIFLNIYYMIQVFLFLLSAVKYYLDNEDLSLRDTCDIYKCSKYSLVSSVANKRYLEYGTVENKDRKEGAYKVRKEHVKPR